MLATVVVTVQLYRTVPKGFLPIQDTGILMGSTIASPDISFKAMEDTAARGGRCAAGRSGGATVGSQVGVASGWSSLNRGQLQVSLKPLDQRGISSEAVIARLRPKLANLGGIQTFLFSAQDLRGGGRSGGSQFQFVVISQDLAGAAPLGPAAGRQAEGHAGRYRRHVGPGPRRPAGKRGDRPRCRGAAGRARPPISTTR